LPSTRRKAKKNDNFGTISAKLMTFLSLFRRLEAGRPTTEGGGSPSATALPGSSSHKPPLRARPSGPGLQDCCLTPASSSGTESKNIDF
jgi:hypothetical protein